MIDREWARAELDGRSTEELVQILTERNEDEWQPEVFPIVEELLSERGVEARTAPVRAADGETGSPLPGAISEGAVKTGPVVLAEFDDEVEAGLCRMALLQAGIEAKLRPHPDSGLRELLVDASRLEAAREILAAAESAAEGDADGDFQCAGCGFMAEPIQEGDRLVCQVCGAVATGVRS
jgi:hypothetical protein